MDLIDAHMSRLRSLSVSVPHDAEAIRSRLARFDFGDAVPLERALAEAAGLLDEGIVHSAHPRCFGLFNPTPSFPGILADAMTATWNPQLAVWSHAPAAVEAELHVLNHVARVLEFKAERGAAHFTSGGAEANATALQVAVTRLFPAYANAGAAALKRRLLIYASAESHLAWLKIAQQAGLGRDALRLVPVDATGCLDADALDRMLAEDAAIGAAPFMIVATAGTTNSGAIDPIARIAPIARRVGAHFHIDAAWAGAAAFSERLRASVAGLADADSLTVDAHKWLSVPMAAGMFFCRRTQWLGDAFRVSTDYMPQGQDELDPYTHSQQWSRRFIGLKLFLTLAALGRAGVAAQIEHQAEMGRLLKIGLSSSRWRVINETPLPVACFVDADGADVRAIAERAVAGGRVWLSITKLNRTTCLRACITSFLTTADDVAMLVDELNAARG